MKKSIKKHQEIKLSKIKKEISDIDLVIPGTIRSIYLKCGKPICACWKDRDARHGPYYFWDRKVDGRVSSKSIKKPMVPLLKKWIDNRKKTENLIQEMLELNQAIVADMVEEEKTLG
jgi:hypothetical protein